MLSVTCSNETVKYEHVDTYGSFKLGMMLCLNAVGRLCRIVMSIAAIRFLGFATRLSRVHGSVMQTCWSD
jgi:hypothetical protein